MTTNNTTKVLSNQVAPSGVGGWLAFLIFSLTVLPLTLGTGTVYGTLAELRNIIPNPESNAAFQRVQGWLWTAHGVSVAPGLVAGWLLWKRRTWQTVPTVIALLWMGVFCGSAAAFYIVHEIAPGAPLFAESIKASFPPAIWTVYLLRSKRVRNTYTA